jgi:hypothetical protein
VPLAADEDRRQLHPELIEVQYKRTEHLNRIKAFLAGQGIALASVTANFPEQLAKLWCWDGSEMGADLRQRLLRAFARCQLANRHVKQQERKKRIRSDHTPHVDAVNRVRVRGGDKGAIRSTGFAQQVI